MQFNPMPLVEAKADILAHQDKFDMSEFVCHPGAPGEIVAGIDCQTSFCIAGSIVVRYVGIKLTPSGSCYPANGQGFEVNAMRIVGMTQKEVDTLFYSVFWGEIHSRFNVPREFATPALAIEVIDEFLRQKGYDPEGQPLKKEEAYWELPISVSA